MYALPCGHTYHEACLHPMMDIQNVSLRMLKCPECRFVNGRPHPPVPGTVMDAASSSEPVSPQEESFGPALERLLDGVDEDVADPAAADVVEVVETDGEDASYIWLTLHEAALRGMDVDDIMRFCEAKYCDNSCSMTYKVIREIPTGGGLRPLQLLLAKSKTVS